MSLGLLFMCLFAGAVLVGELPRSGIGKAVSCDVVPSLDRLWQERVKSNAEVLRSMKENEHSDWMLEAALKDAALGRLSTPVEAQGCFHDEALLHPRFAVAKDLPDGSVKRRGVDHFSWSAGGAGKEASVNGATSPQEKMSHDTLDLLAEVLCLFRGCVPDTWVGETPGLFKADIDSAFRRIPVRATDRWACGLSFAARGKTFIAQRYACPFGAVASVHAWKRIGAALCHIAQTFLMLPILRYVDDYFGPDRLATVEHGLQCFVRLVRLLLGSDAVADDKTAFGSRLDILGVDLEMSLKGFKFRPAAEKCARWRATIVDALFLEQLLPGAASKLAGRLSWACSRLFHRFGRATLRAIFDQKSLRSGDMSPELRRCLQWWLRVLDMDLAE
jgi:hypothetical protein